MPVFDARSDYIAERDVRNSRPLVELLRSLPQKAVLWPLVGARRAGKTWALRAIERQLDLSAAGSAHYLNLREFGRDLPSPEPGSCVLLDEPELAGEGDRLRDPREFLQWCRVVRGTKTKILLAMSPAEWVALRQAGEETGLVSVKDLRFLAPLSNVQAERLARTDTASTLLARLPLLWRRNPFLLELVFQIAEEAAEADPSLLGDVGDLLDAVGARSEDAEFFYFEAVFYNGLVDAQRAAIQRVARGLAADSKDTELLRRCGLLETEKGGSRMRIADPILEANLCPLRIHHVSDIHFGPKSAKRVDVKEKGDHAKALAGALGSARVCDAYAGHVAELAASGLGPHLLVVSGDIAEWADDDQYADAIEWIGKLQEHLADHPRLRKRDPRVLLVGGNHDVDWRQVDGPGGAAGRRRHVPFARAFHEVPRSVRARLDEPPETRELAVARYPNLGVELLLLGSAEFGGETEKDPVREALLDLIRGFRREAMAEVDAEKAAHLRDRVSRIDPGLVHDADLERVRQFEWRLPVRIAVLHHPVSPLPATELVRFAGLLNAGEVKDTLVRKEFCLVLHGHAHTGWFGKEQWPGRYKERSIRIAAAPSLGSREVQEHHGFNEIEVLRETNDGETSYAITVRRFCREGTAWVEKASMGPFAPGG